MKSDVIHVKSTGEGVKDALLQAEAVAKFKNLSKKDAIHLRLLTEEMMGMMRGLTKERSADFFIEDENEEFRIHLITETAMNSELRKKLISSSTSGKNSAASGFMGKIRELFERVSEPVDGSMSSSFVAGWAYVGTDSVNAMPASAMVWSLNKYKDSAKEEKKEDWDELEKSIVANVADEIKIGIKNNTVEMIIYKKFNKEA